MNTSGTSVFGIQNTLYIKIERRESTVKEVVSKIRILRNTYNNELLKGKKCTKTGMGTNEVYVSKIPWLIHMDFLKNIDSYTRENTENMVRYYYFYLI